MEIVLNDAPGWVSAVGGSSVVSGAEAGSSSSQRPTGRVKGRNPLAEYGLIRALETEDVRFWKAAIESRAPKEATPGESSAPTPPRRAFDIGEDDLVEAAAAVAASHDSPPRPDARPPDSMEADALADFAAIEAELEELGVPPAAATTSSTSSAASLGNTDLDEYESFLQAMSPPQKPPSE
jgi:hypothetical protein